MLLLAAHTTKFIFLSLTFSHILTLLLSLTHADIEAHSRANTHPFALPCASWYTTRSQYTKQSKPALFQRISFSFSRCPLHSLSLEKCKKSVVVISSLSPLSLHSQSSLTMFKTFSFAFSPVFLCLTMYFLCLVSTLARASVRGCHLLEILSVNFYLGTLPAQKKISSPLNPVSIEIQRHRHQLCCFFIIFIINRKNLTQWGCIICEHSAWWLHLSLMKNASFC